MTWTDAGFAALVNAEHNGTLPVLCKYIALGAGTTAADAEDTSLEDEIKRIETISGTVVDNNVIHVVLRDESSDAYTATEIGLIDDNGTLLARYAQATPLITKAAGAVALLAVDASFTNVDATQITFGDITFTNPPWGESTPGVVQKATQAQAEEGTDNNTGMTPRRVMQLLESLHLDTIDPAGRVIAYAGATIPDGWLRCDGAAVSRTAYADLFSAIGITYGSGDQSSTFNVPDLRGEFLRGLDAGRDVDAGRTLGSHQNDALQNITGQVDFRGRDPAGGSTFIPYGATGIFRTEVEGGASQTTVAATVSPITTNGTRLTIDASRSGRTATETRPRNVAMNYIIRY